MGHPLLSLVGGNQVTRRQYFFPKIAIIYLDAQYGLVQILQLPDGYLPGQQLKGNVQLHQLPREGFESTHHNLLMVQSQRADRLHIDPFGFFPHRIGQNPIVQLHQRIVGNRYDTRGIYLVKTIQPGQILPP